MANSIGYNFSEAIYFSQDSAANVSPIETPSFNRSFRVSDVVAFVTTLSGGSTVTIARNRAGVVTTLCTLSGAATGRVTPTSIDQSVALFESGDTMRFTASDATVRMNVVVSTMPQSI